MIKVGKKALEVLKSISVINEGAILRDDYLYTRYENPIDDAKSKGEDGITVSYTLPEGEVQIEEYVGLGNINEFLTIHGTFNNDELTMVPKGTTIEMKDKRKKVTFYTTTVDALPERNFGGEELYEAGKSVISFVLDEAEIEKVTKDLSILNIDKLSLRCDDGVVKIVAANSISANETEIKVDEKLTAVATGEFTFPNHRIFDVIAKGIYKIDIRSCDYNGTELIICKLTSATIEGLEYVCVSEE